MAPQRLCLSNESCSLPASVPANRQASQEANAQGSEPDKAECTWRPAAVAIIRELARNNGLVEMGAYCGYSWRGS